MFVQFTRHNSPLLLIISVFSLADQSFYDEYDEDEDNKKIVNEKLSFAPYFYSILPDSDDNESVDEIDVDDE